MRVCDVTGCGRKHWSSGLCNRHYQRKRKTGSTDMSWRAENGAPLAWLEWAATQELTECLPYPFAAKDNGYGAVNHEGETKAASHVLCLIVYGAPPPGHEAAHSCGNRPCCNKAHLRWATPTDNASDRVLHGTDNRGERNSRAKLTWPEVRAIRSSRARQKDIALQFGVSQSHVSAIIANRFWRPRK